jgi:hypothetical protein
VTVVVIGRDVGIEGVVIESIDDAAFDSTSEMWTVRGSDGRTVTARILVDARPHREDVMAAHGMPNIFRITAGPGDAAADRQARYVSRCVALLERTGSTRIEAKSRITLRRWRPQPVASRFYLSGTQPEDDDLYDGPAVLTHAGRDIDTRVRLTGHLEAIDGRYHWRGTVAGDLPSGTLKHARAVIVSINGRSAEGQLVEQTPWGDYTVAGVGSPPYQLD